MEAPTGQFLSKRIYIALANLQNYSSVGNRSLDIQDICRILWNTKALIHDHHHHHHRRNNPINLQPSSEDAARPSGFHCFGLATIISLTEQGHEP
jgi:hypothetical protein